MPGKTIPLDVPSPLSFSPHADSKFMPPTSKPASSPLLSSLQASHRKALLPREGPSRGQKRKQPEEDEEDSDHDEAWHDTYYATSASYDELKSAVKDMGEQGVPFATKPYTSSGLHHCSKKLYRLFGHSGPAALDIATKCHEAGLEYISYPVESLDDLDHGKFIEHRRKFEEDLSNSQVAGLVTDPACETFLNTRLRDVAGPGR